MPFGNLESFFVSDPIVIEMAESRAKGAALGIEKGGFNASVTAFESEVNGTKDYNAVLAASYEI